MKHRLPFTSNREQLQSLFGRIVEHAADGILVVNADGYVVFSNPAVARIFQRREDEFIGELFGFPIAAGDSTEINILRKDGVLAVAEMRVSDAYWAQERVFIAILRDITDRKQLETDLHKATEELAALYRCAPLGVIALDADKRIKLWNPAAESIFGWKEGEIVGCASSDFSALLRQYFPEIGESTWRSTGNLSKEIRHHRADGSPVDVNILLAPILDQSAETAGVICIVEDISRRLRDAEQLRLAGKIFENAQEGILVTDADGIIVAVNHAFVSITGYEAAEVIGQKPSILHSTYHTPTFYEEMWRTLRETGQWRGEIWNRRKNGSIYPEWLNINVIRDAEGTISQFFAIFSDITQIKENEERLRHLAHFDVLTDLPNRFLFQDHAELALAQAARNGKQVAIMFLDLDRFKSINDTLGHRAGDSVLVEVAKRLSGCLRAGDTLGRFGGDEFNAVLPDLQNIGAAASVAEKFMEALSLPFHIEGKEFHVTSSMGIAIFPQDGNQLEQLARAADAAMYQAKAQGRNAFRFYEADGQDKALSRRFFMENQLRRAQERGQLSLVYQPEIDMHSGVVSGVEALLRWQHPELGEVLPEEFIPLAEEIGLMPIMGAWILREACRQNRLWQASGLTLRVSVNLSLHQLRDRSLVESISNILAETGMPGSSLELELTEQVLMQHIEETLVTLNALRQIGVRFAVDNFGAGQSSLRYLSKLPINKLKIDRSLVGDIATNKGNAAISRTIITLARDLDLRAVAKGVESQAQLQRLFELECGDAQGFYFSHPLPAEQLTELLGAHDFQGRLAVNVESMQ